MKKKKIFLVDDHPSMRQGLAILIHQEPDLAVCGEAGDIPSAIEGIRKTKPDIAVIDLTLGAASGLNLLKDLKARSMDVPVLVLSMHNEAVYAERAIRSGARGYIMKEATTGSIIEAIRSVLAGDVYLSPGASSGMLRKMAGIRSGPQDPVESLSDRELEVFRLVGQGVMTRDIAVKLHLSVKTVESYRENIKAKLNLDNSVQLVRAAVEWTATHDRS